MKKFLYFKHARLKKDEKNYKSPSATAPLTDNKSSSEIGQLWGDTARLYAKSSYKPESPPIYEKAICSNNHSTSGVHSPCHTPDQLIKTHPTCSSDIYSPPHLVPLQQSVLNSFHHLSTSSFVHPRYLPADDEHPGPITYEIFMKQQQQEKPIPFYCHSYDNATLFSSHSMNTTIPEQPLTHQFNNLTTFSPSPPSSSSSLELPLPTSILTPTAIVKRQTNNNRHPCLYLGCDRSFDTLGHLRCHERKHLGIKPYSCTWPECSWRFSRSDELTRHYRRHTGVKPYVCKYCSRAFTRSDHLRSHIRSHF